ncbi:MAG TPA: ribonuclease M5 [Haloplasmataceae bacterium]
MHFKEIIVVEGKEDTRKLKSIFPFIETIETRGSAIDEKTLQLIEKAQKEKGVIVFTDPDYQGERIRKVINQRISGCKNAYIKKEKAIDEKKHKVGIEHCLNEDIIEALSCITEVNPCEVKIDYNELMEMKLIGSKDSHKLRNYISDKLHLGCNNAKQFHKKINLFNISKKTLMELIECYQIEV